MSDRAAFVSAIAAAPDDDLPKLVFADWLDENGDPNRAEFIRLSVAYFREATAFPPKPDPAKLARIRELFHAHHLAWLRPVYEPLGQPLPTFTATQDRWAVQPTGGVAVSHHSHLGVSSVLLNGGLVDTLLLHPAHLPETASLAAAMAAEPLDTLHLTVPAVAGGWERFDGPHLGRVRALSVQFDHNTGGRDVRPVAEVLCDPARFPGVRAFTVTPEVWGGDGTPGAVLFDTLCHSPIRHQLTTLTLYDLPHLTRLLARADHGFDALHELTVSTRGQPGGADALFAGGISHWFRERLTRLAMDTTRTHGLGWLTGGRPWDRLERLLLSGSGVGDVGAAALAQADTLAALRELRLYRVNVTPVGAAALAASPLVGRLQALFLDRNSVGDAGAVRLAGALDRGLRFLALRDCQPALSPSLVRELSARYGPRIAFDR
jgi:uncharacterized protein (TIGR02996 family)